MKHYIKQALDALHALDCRLDHADRELRTDRWRFTHPNAPDEFFTIAVRSSEQACRTVVQRAKVAAGLATSDMLEKRKPKANQRQKMERAAERKRIATARALAEAKAAAERTRKIEAQAARNHRELDRLLRGRDYGREGFPLYASDLPADALLTVEQVADSTGVTDVAVLRAIENGKLEAYQCGKQVKVKGADVRSWLGATAVTS